MELLNISDPKDMLSKKEKQKGEQERQKKKEISAEGFDMDCGGRLGRVVKGRPGSLVIG